MHRVKEAIVVEGRYDKNALSQVVDALILETSGFGLFKDREKQKLLRLIAQAKGLIVLTDSDGAGFVIRRFISSCVDPALVKHAYIPDIYGRERRKSAPSKEGKLGVEGMQPQILLEALIRAGATLDDAAPETRPAQIISTGIAGLVYVPERLTADGLLAVLNAVMSREEFYALHF